MPKIIQVQQQGQATGGLQPSRRKSQVSDFNMGTDLLRLSQGLGGTAKDLTRMAEQAQQRQDSMAAADAYSNFQLKKISQMEEIKKSPPQIDGLGGRFLKQYDQDVESFASNLSPGAAEIFKRTAVSSRAGIAGQAIRFEAAEKTRIAKLNYSNSIANIEEAAKADPANLGTYLNQVSGVNASAVNTGVIRGQEYETVNKKDAERIAKNVLGSTISSNPSLALTLLEDGVFDVLGSDKSKYEQEAQKAFLREGDKIELQRISQEMRAIPEVHNSYLAGTLTYEQVDKFEENKFISDELADFYRGKLEPLPDTPEQEFEEAVQKGVQSFEVGQEVRRRTGRLGEAEAKKELTKLQKSQIRAGLNERYLELKNKDGDIDPAIDLREVSDFYSEVARQAPNLTQSELDRYMTKLGPALQNRIEEKHGGWFGFGAQTDMQRDPYGSAMEDALALLESNPALNTSLNRATLIDNIVDRADVSIKEDMSPQDREAALNKAAQDAYYDVLRMNTPTLKNVPSDQMPAAIIRGNGQAVNTGSAAPAQTGAGISPSYKLRTGRDGFQYRVYSNGTFERIN